MSNPYDEALPDYLQDEFSTPRPPHTPTAPVPAPAGESVFGAGPVEMIPVEPPLPGAGLPQGGLPTAPVVPSVPVQAPVGGPVPGGLPTAQRPPVRPVGVPPPQGGLPTGPVPVAPVQVPAGGTVPTAPVSRPLPPAPSGPAPYVPPVAPVTAPAAPYVPPVTAPVVPAAPVPVAAPVEPVAAPVTPVGVPAARRPEPVEGLPVREPVPVRTPTPVPVPTPVVEDVDEFDEFDADADAAGEAVGGKRKPPAKVAQATSPRINRPRTKKGTGSSRKGPMLVTERDRHVMMTLARYRFATLEHMRRVMDTSEDMARRRLNRMEDSGYIKSYRLEHNGTRLLSIAENGLAYLNSSLSVPRFTIKSLGHTLAATDIGLQFEAHGETVVTEREIRAMDLRGLRPGATFDMDELNSDEMYVLDPVTGTPMLDPAKVAAVDTLNRYRSWAMVTNRDGKGFTKIPDLVLDRPMGSDGVPHAVAVEVELTLKSQPSEYEALLRAYAESGRYAKVLYLTPDKAVRRYVQEAVDKLNLGEFVEIRKFVPSTHLPGYSGHVARGRGPMTAAF